MLLRDVAYWLGIPSMNVGRIMSEITGKMKGSFKLTDEITLEQAKELWEGVPNHRRVLLIQIQPDAEGNDHSGVTMLGNWDGQKMRVADRLFKRAYKQYKHAIATGTERTAFRTEPTEEEIAAIRREDEARIKALQKAPASEQAKELQEEELERVLETPMDIGDPDKVTTLTEEEMEARGLLN